MELVNAHIRGEEWYPVFSPQRGQCRGQMHLPTNYIPKDLLEKWEKVMKDFEEVQKEMEEFEKNSA